MRKRIIIGLLAIVVIGVVAFVVSQPKKGSVEWHKKEYLAAWKELHGETWGEQIKEIAYDITGHRFRPRKLTSAERGRLDKQAESNRVALVRLGYLGKRKFILTNCTPQAVFKSASASEMRGPFVTVWYAENELGVAAPSDVIIKWEEIVRKLDVP